VSNIPHEEAFPPPPMVRKSKDNGESTPPPHQENQQPASGGDTNTGLWEKPGTGGDDSQPHGPSLAHIVPADLQDTSRLLALYEQAVDHGLVNRSINDRLNFIAAAEHARIVGSHNPCGLFAELVRRKRYEFVTQSDEDRAQQRLKLFDFGDPRQRQPLASPCPPSSLSKDAVIMQALLRILREIGYRGDPFEQLHTVCPDWTRARYVHAMRDITAVQVEAQRRQRLDVGEGQGGGGEEQSDTEAAENQYDSKGTALAQETD
jgi:hypothetical protein